MSDNPPVGTYALPFPPEEYAERLRRVRAEMEAENLDAVFITAHRNFRWLSGGRVNYNSAESPQWMLIDDGEPVGIVRHLEAGTHRTRSCLTEWEEYYDEANPYDPVAVAAALAARRGLGSARIGISLRHGDLSPHDYRRFCELLPDAEFVDFSVVNIRIRRSSREIECIRRAVKVNQDALAGTIYAIRPGWSEQDIQHDIRERHEECLGHAHDSAMGPTVCQVGEHMKEMHAIRSRQEMEVQKIWRDTGAWLEPGVFVHGYVGSMLRTVWMGEPPRVVRYAVESSIEALNLLIDAIAPGKTAEEVDAVPRNYLTERGLDIQHRSGYTSSEYWLDGGIISLTPKNPFVLEPGHVFHSPIHVFLPEFGYVGASEQLFVTEDGCEVLGDRDRTCERKLYTI